jgi:hypothetical protein
MPVLSILQRRAHRRPGRRISQVAAQPGGGTMEKRRYVMGDKGKKDKDKARKQKINKQAQTAKSNLEKLPAKTPA